MAEVTLERVIEEIKQLTDEEQQQLRRTLNSWRPASKQQEWTAAQEALLLQRLLGKGIIGNIPSGMPDDTDDGYIPVKVLGRPVSETLLEDREPR